MKIIKIILLISITIMIILGLFLIFFNNKNLKNDEIKTNLTVESNCLNLNYSEMGQCFANIALEHNNASKCEDIPSMVSRSGIVFTCYEDYGIMKQDSKYCRFGEGSPEMITGCAYEIAKSTGNIQHCENSGSEMFNPELHRDQCYSDMAVYLHNRSVCDLLTEIQRTRKCYAEVAMAIGINDSDCKDTDKFTSKLCYASINNNVSYCDDGDRQINGCYYDYAVLKNDSSVCYKMNDETEREYCLKHFQ